MSSRVPLLLRYFVSIAGVLFIVLAGYLTYAHFYHAPLRPISYVKEEYVRCIGLHNEKATGICLNTLAQYAYVSYPIDDIASQIDSLTLPQKERWCHEMMHYMGWEAYRQEKNIADAFVHSTLICDSGMYHGVMEEYLRENGLQKNIVSVIQNICETSLADNRDLSNGTKALCYHGLGHGLMYINEGSLKKSLNDCDTLQGLHSSECYSGVFMEYALSKAVGPLSDEQKPDLSNFNYCNDLTQKQREICLNRQGTNNFMFTHGDIKQAMTMCLKIDPPYQDACFAGVGNDVPSPESTYTDAEHKCEQSIGIASSTYTQCIKGALGFVTQLEHGDPKGAVEFCGAVREAQKPFCYHEAGTNLVVWLRQGQNIQSVCSAFPNAEAQLACSEGDSYKNNH